MDLKTNKKAKRSVDASLEVEAEFSIEIENSTIDTPSKLQIQSSDSFQHNPSIFNCIICLEFPRKFVYQCPNGHLLCQNCVKCLKQKSYSTCPTCQVSVNLEALPRNKVAEKLIPLQIQNCQNEKCKFTGNKKELNIHVRNCEYQQTSCPFYFMGCRKKTQKNILADHKNNCSYGKKGLIYYFTKNKETLEDLANLFYHDDLDILQKNERLPHKILFSPTLGLPASPTKKKNHKNFLKMFYKRNCCPKISEVEVCNIKDTTYRSEAFTSVNKTWRFTIEFSFSKSESSSDADELDLEIEKYISYKICLEQFHTVTTLSKKGKRESFTVSVVPNTNLIGFDHAPINFKAVYNNKKRKERISGGFVWEFNIANFLKSKKDEGNFTEIGEEKYKSYIDKLANNILKNRKLLFRIAIINNDDNDAVSRKKLIQLSNMMDDENERNLRPYDGTHTDYDDSESESNGWY